MNCLGCKHPEDAHAESMGCTDCLDEYRVCPAFIEPDTREGLRSRLGQLMRTHRELKRTMYAPKSHVSFMERHDAGQADFTVRYAIGATLRGLKEAQTAAA